MTKELYPAPGRIKVICKVTSIRNKRKFTSTETGTNSMHNVAKEYQEKIRNAKLNAIYKHMNRGGGSDATVEVIDFDIVYFTDKVKLHKEEEIYEYKDGYRKRTIVYATDKETGKRVNAARIVKKAKKDTFEIQSI